MRLAAFARRIFFCGFFLFTIFRFVGIIYYALQKAKFLPLGKTFQILADLAQKLACLFSSSKNVEVKISKNAYASCVNVNR